LLPSSRGLPASLAVMLVFSPVVAVAGRRRGLAAFMC
jgi:hypothetical protein